MRAPAWLRSLTYGPLLYGPLRYGPLRYGPLRYGPLRYGPLLYGQRSGAAGGGVGFDGKAANQRSLQVHSDPE